MQDFFKIYIDRLKTTDNEDFKFDANPSFLKVDEKELVFNSAVNVTGKAYLAQDDLVIDLNIKTNYNMPCSICNELTENSLLIKHFIQTVALNTIKDSIFDFSLLTRNEILLQIPSFIECNSGNCIQRKELNQYLTKNCQGYFPFQEL